MSGARLQHRVEYALVRLARAFDRMLGPRLSGALAARLGRLAYRPFRVRADVVDEQLREAFPDREPAWRRRIARAAYEHLGREGMMLLRLSRLGRDDVIAATDVHGLDRLRAAVEAGTGAVLMTGHFGNWEIGGASIAARGIPLDVVAQRQKNPLFDALITRAREQLGMTVIRKGGATKAALRSLERGRVVALVADQDARRRGVFVPFFGRPASTHRGPAVLALRSGAPVFMGTAARRAGGRYEVTIREVPVPEAGDPEERADRLTADLTAALEAAVRADPGQYLWQHRRWKTRPGNGGGAPAV
ncbi:MAG: lysophospholipid acyltransferase family protein [Gemmatimonadota bacterium]